MPEPITFEEVAEAVQALRAAGQQPTRINIREQLGGRGSYSTIGRHLAALASEGAAGGDAVSLPAGMASLWASALAAARTELTPQIEALERERSEVAALRSRLEADQAERNAERQRMQDLVRATEQRLRDRDADVEIARAAAEAAEVRLAGFNEVLTKSLASFGATLRDAQQQTSTAVSAAVDAVRASLDERLQVLAGEISEQSGEIHAHIEAVEAAVRQDVAISRTESAARADDLHNSMGAVMTSRIDDVREEISTLARDVRDVLLALSQLRERRPAGRRGLRKRR